VLQNLRPMGVPRPGIEPGLEVPETSVMSFSLPGRGCGRQTQKVPQPGGANKRVAIEPVFGARRSREFKREVIAPTFGAGAARICLRASEMDGRSLFDNGSRWRVPAMNRISWPRLALLWVIGVDLRITLLAVPPLVPLIHRDLPLDETAVAVLLGLPVLLLAAAATLGSLIISRFDARRTAILGVALLGASSALRGVGPSLTMLFAMTLLMGASIAIVQPALPALVYHWTPTHVGVATAVYSNGLLIGELIGAGLTTQVAMPLAGSWQGALALWGMLALITAPILWWMTPTLGAAEGSARPLWIPDFHRGLTWRLGLIQAGGGTIYFGANAFLPDYLHHAGASRLIAPSLLWLNAAQLPASIAIALRPQWFVGRSRPVQAMALVAAAGLGVFFIPHVWARVVGAGMLGFSAAFGFVLSLAFPPLLAETPGEVHRISAGMFTIGYGMAFLVPLLAGAAWDRTGIAAVALAPVAIGALCLLLAPRGLKTDRQSQIEADSPESDSSTK
jgi:MFS transporter, CP family, cyanate transporter